MHESMCVCVWMCASWVYVMCSRVVGSVVGYHKAQTKKYFFFFHFFRNFLVWLIGREHEEGTEFWRKFLFAARWYLSQITRSNENKASEHFSYVIFHTFNFSTFRSQDTTTTTNDDALSFQRYFPLFPLFFDWFFLSISHTHWTHKLIVLKTLFFFFLIINQHQQQNENSSYNPIGHSGRIAQKNKELVPFLYKEMLCRRNHQQIDQKCFRLAGWLAWLFWG